MTCVHYMVSTKKRKGNNAETKQVQHIGRKKKKKLNFYLKVFTAVGQLLSYANIYNSPSYCDLMLRQSS